MRLRGTPSLRPAAVLALALGCATTASCSSTRPPAQQLPMELLQNRHGEEKDKKEKKTGSIVGEVRGADDKPVSFALVAAVSVQSDPEDGDPPRLTTSLEGGKFELGDLPPGNYGLTVMAPAANAVDTPPSAGGPAPVPAGSFAGIVPVAAGDPGLPVLLRLGTQGLTLSGRVTDDKGSPLPSALVRAVRESPYQGDHFFAKARPDGRFQGVVPPGRYFLVGQAEGRRPVRVDVAEGPRTDIEVRLPPSLVLPAKEELTAWIASAGSLVDPENPPASPDLSRLREIAGKARLVALGEASYTGSETWKLKSRMFRFFVEKMGFSVLFIEATQADVRPLDDYVLHGTGHLPELLAKIGYFAFDTAEAAELYAWMRAYNDDRRHGTKLRVAGVDVQRTAAAATELEVYLAKVDKGFVASVETTLDRLRDNELTAALRKRPADEQDRVLSDVALVMERLDKQRRAYVARSTSAEYARAVEDAQALSWAARAVKDEKQRGAAMADLAKRALGAAPRGTKAVLWAHDTQVSRRKADGGMGALLADTYEADYVSIGFTFHQGWIRAWDFTLGPTLERGTKLFRLPEPEQATLEGLLAASGSVMFYADVRKAPASLSPWLDSRLPMRSASSAFVSERRARTRTVVREAFDALVFVRKQTAVTLSATGKRPGRHEGNEDK